MYIDPTENTILYSSGETQENLIRKILEASEYIRKESMKPKANFIMTGMKQSDALNAIIEEQEERQKAYDTNDDRLKKLNDILNDES